MISFGFFLFCSLPFQIDISCRQTKQTVSSILTRTNYVTLKYVTDNWGTDANGFKLVITSIKDPSKYPILDMINGKSADIPTYTAATVLSMITQKSLNNGYNKKKTINEYE